MGLLQFKNRKLNKKAREFRHEVYHLTLDILEINRRIHESAALCKFKTENFGKAEKAGHIDHPRHSVYFDDLLYHLENFIFRVQAYKDKMCLFINFSLNLGFEEKDYGLFWRLLKNPSVREMHLDTELKKLDRGSVSEILKQRKVMSHRSYYKNESYNPLFIPKNISPKEVGHRRAALLWKRNIIVECNKANQTTLRILEVNRKTVLKVDAFLKDK